MNVRTTPRFVMSALQIGMPVRTTTKAIEYTKFEQVETNALVSRRPRIEYTRQPMPASAIIVAPTAGGASMPGIRSQARPPKASSQPSHSVSLRLHEFEYEAIGLAAKSLGKNALGMVISCVGQDIGIALDHEAGGFGSFKRQRFFDSV